MTIVASNSLFGATLQMLNNILSRFGITTTCVSQTDTAAWDAAIRPNTKLFFLETPSNPLTEIADIRTLCDVAHARNILVAVDNCFCTPILQRPLDGADLVVHSATNISTARGARWRRRRREDIHRPGARLPAHRRPHVIGFNAWVLLKGLETLQIRMEAQSAKALQLAQWLEAHPKVARVFYPGCHRIRSMRWRCDSRGTVAPSSRSRSRGARSEAWRVVDSCELLSITANPATPRRR